MMYPTVTNALAKLLKTPQYLILFVSDRCWMKCRHCWYNEEWKGKNLTGAPLTFDELEKTARSIGRIQFLSLTGGEAFLRDDIVAVAEMFARTTSLKRYDVPTSGYDTDLVVSAAKKILEVNRGIPFRVNVSIDGTERTHESIRGVPGGYRRALETVRGLNDLKRHFPYFDVGIITTISRRNQNEVEAIADAVMEVNRGGEWMVNITRGDTRDRDAVKVDTSNYVKAGKIIEERQKNGKHGGHGGHTAARWLTAKNAVRREVITGILEGGIKRAGCAAGTLGGVIFNDGTVRPCEMLDDTFGNLRDFDYQMAALWNSPEAVRLRNRIQETRCTCTHECFLSVSLLIQPRYWPKIVKKRLELLLNGS